MPSATKLLNRELAFTIMHTNKDLPPSGFGVGNDVSNSRQSEEEEVVQGYVGAVGCLQLGWSNFFAQIK